MSSIISNWSPVLVTPSFTVWSEALDSGTMITRCQANGEAPAIWQPSPVRPAARGHPSALSSGRGDAALPWSTWARPRRPRAGQLGRGALAARVRDACVWRSCSSSMIQLCAQPLLCAERIRRCLGSKPVPAPLPTASAKQVRAVFS